MPQTTITILGFFASTSFESFILGLCFLKSNSNCLKALGIYFAGVKKALFFEMFT